MKALALILIALSCTACARNHPNPEPGSVQFSTPVAHGAFIGQAGDVAIYVFIDNETGSTCHIADNVHGYATSISCIPMEPQDE